ncbi:uncharacterized protein si:dkey-79i2.4 [Danio rerio]|uniref:Uncharacterized protein si:dkey-79i2.4 n=1 Tax=Danio rerio TaxID=7955 RepID=A0AC58I0M5_DANRE|nr:verrucotoxin subunit beta isoform X2 [Danio rerio]|eukprot:XP_001922696.2 verrucotoxin subunit beta isoform X2 [Danio rerio]
MDSVGVNVIETAALGRPFQLGMLYDCRKDALVPGITLWDKEQLQQSIHTRPQINTDFKVSTSDSIEDKSSIFNIDSCLEFSLLGGLLHVSGAAKYLNDTKMSFKQQRLTLHYHSTSKFEELTMNHLASGNISHHEVFENDTATHVVTAVLYGADACFVFDREVSSDENESTIAAEVQVALNKLKGISVGANIDLSINDSQKNAFQKFSCTFYGDFQLQSNPTSFEDALKVYADLPKMLGENKELVVPLRVWLYPLDKLHSRAAKLQRYINITLIKNFESVIESLNSTEMKCGDLLKDTPALTFAAFNIKVKNMKQNCHNYKLSLMKQLGILLPKIRGDMEKDSALIDLLCEHEESPFRRSDLEQWLKEKENESNIIKTLLRQLNESGAKVEDNLDKSLMDLEVENLLCYTFTSFERLDVLISKQKTYLSPSSMKKNGSISDFSQTTWLTPEIKNTMRSNLQLFKSMINLKVHKPVKFIATSKEMENNPGSCILLYEKGSDEAICFTPPTKPACPIAEKVRGDKVVLKVPSPCPDTVETKLQYKMKTETEWKSQPLMQSQDTVTLTDLSPDTEYEIKCTSIGKLSYSVDSDVISVIRKAIKGTQLLPVDALEHLYEIKVEDKLKEIKEILYTQDLPTAFGTISNYFKETSLVLNIGVTGESGSGKSTFVNAFRGLGDEDEGSAKTSSVVTTAEPEVYFHPKYENVKLWDLPGIGTPNFKADKYLELVEFERYDFFIIIASDRFRECHTQLAKGIMRMGKKFYFVRSKIDASITAEKKKKNFDQKKTLDSIREDCENGLRKIGIEYPVVFLISGWDLGKYDLNLLQEMMEKEILKCKRILLKSALLNVKQEVIEQRKDTLKRNIERVTEQSVAITDVHLPGLSISVNVDIIAEELTKYYSEFGLDDQSLQKLCERSGKTIEELKSLMKSPLCYGINTSLIINLLEAEVPKIENEYFLSFMPFIGTEIKKIKSSVAVSSMLKTALNVIAEDIRNVIIALLETEV